MSRSLAIPLLVAAALAPGCASAAASSRTVEIAIHYSRFAPSSVEVPAGVPITFVIRNEDPIDHEWMIGDAAMHARHRTGTEPVHGSRADEITVPALSTRTTTLTFPNAVTLQYMCHLPGHEAYGMVGTLTAR